VKISYGMWMVEQEAGVKERFLKCSELQPVYPGDVEEDTW
jgi:hypothetical protein